MSSQCSFLWYRGVRLRICGVNGVGAVYPAQPFFLVDIVSCQRGGFLMMGKLNLEDHQDALPAKSIFWWGKIEIPHASETFIIDPVASFQKGFALCV